VARPGPWPRVGLRTGVGRLLGGLCIAFAGGCASPRTPPSDATAATQDGRPDWRIDGIDVSPPDAAVDLAAPEGAVDLVVPDATVEIVTLDGAVDLVTPDASIDLAAPDAADLGPANCSADDDPGEPAAQPARAGQLPPRRWMLGPWYGTLCGWPYSDTTITCSEGITTPSAQATATLDGFDRYDIPTTAMHFDGNAWSRWTSDPITANECASGLDDALIGRLRETKVKALLHFWGHCVTAQDFDRAWGALPGVLGGFYLDDGAGTLVSGNVLEWLRTTLPDDGAFVSKRYPYPDSWTPWGPGYGGIPDDWNQEHGHSAYVNDLTHDWDGMAEGIRRVFDSVDILPAPFNEFLGFQSFPAGTQPPTLEQYYRRLHFGALQVVMDNSPFENLDPWRSEWDEPRLVLAYRYYAWLHLELGPYLHSYDRAAYETGAPIFRSPDRDAFTTMLGDEIFVAYVTGDAVTQLPVELPPGEWIDYWDGARTYVGPGAHVLPVGEAPPALASGAVTGREPILIRRGAIIPMDVRRDYTGHGTRESDGSLTVLVYPAGDTSFRYFDDDAGRWVTLNASLAAGGLVLSTSRRVSRPLLYRIEGWPEPPRSIATCGHRVLVNGDPTGMLPPADSEVAANGATQSTWFYDETAKRLIVKAVDEPR
jgi:hypothetical protein